MIVKMVPLVIMPTHPFRFPRRERLKKPAEFQAVFARRRSVAAAGVIVYGMANGLPYNRVGLSVSRKVGGAVQRNRWKRLFREAYRLSRPMLPVGFDLVLVPRGTEPPSLATLQPTLVQLVQQLAQKLVREKQS